MKPDIKDKLQRVLSKDLLEETDVVYILSRVRKLMEIDNKEKNYKKLKFYCDWALHKQIDNTDAMSGELENFIDGKSEGSRFPLHESFHKEFKSFLDEYKLKTNIYSDNKTVLNFTEQLTNIYSDTPLILKVYKKKKITLKSAEVFKITMSDGKEVNGFGTTFEITDK